MIYENETEIRFMRFIMSKGFHDVFNELWKRIVVEWCMNMKAKVWLFYSMKHEHD